MAARKGAVSGPANPGLKRQRVAAAKARTRPPKQLQRARAISDKGAQGRRCGEKTEGAGRLSCTRA
eukprot:CAMPEP_0177316756 /NCGR_PEP_ID=MMETSP0368-20130122/13169_1 /TAXON_ID=447022 ORGANISM="Scrippsiella hangoei-like, Strain SHHI-4" /NCGR_SAMPLE_ID=MMETSP0368 /ASSEMBLY_ACC=CAM_ASM_000363 /LENGTH=65 /DNA_ID=CAMNT_0018776057 /DNA_START=62 /DNA_END=259 /DNA_ORIENTATION=+